LLKWQTLQRTLKNGTNMNPYFKKYQYGGKGEPEDPIKDILNFGFTLPKNESPIGLGNNPYQQVPNAYSWSAGSNPAPTTQAPPLNKEYAVGTTVPSKPIPIELTDIQKEQIAIRKQQEEKEAQRQQYIAQRNEANKYIPGKGKTNALGLYGVSDPNTMRVLAMNQAATQAAEFTGVPSVMRVAQDPVGHLNSTLRTMDELSTLGTMPYGSYNTPEDVSKALDVASAAGTILPIAKGLNAAEGLNIAGKYLTTNTPLKNSWKLNPYATRLKQYNRVVGQDAIEDFVESGLVRSGEYGGVQKSLGPFNTSRTTPYPSFSAGKPNQTYISQTISQGKNPFIISTDRPMAPSTLGRHGKGSTMFPVDESGQFLESFPATQAELFESTPHWLKGYQKTFNPYSEDIVNAVKRWDDIGYRGLSRKEVNAQNELRGQWMEYQNQLKKLESEGYKAGDKPVMDVIDSMNKLENDFYETIMTNRYNQAGMSKFFEMPGGSGSFGTVFPFKENSSLLYKVGTLSPTDSFESTLDLIKKGRLLKDSNISIPKSLVEIPGVKRGISRDQIYGSVIKKVPGSSAKTYSRSSKIPQQAIDEMAEKLKLLRDKNIEADYAGDNFFYDPSTGKLSVFDLNTSSSITQLPKHPLSRADWSVRVNRSNEEVSDILNNVFGNKQTNTGKLPSLMLPGPGITKGRSIFGSQPSQTLRKNTLKNNISFTTQNRHGGKVNPYLK